MGSSRGFLQWDKGLIAPVANTAITLPLKHTKLLLGVLILTSGLLGLLRFEIMQVGATVDDAQYVVLAESLAAGDGYGFINFPDPSLAPHGIAFPPGWPLLLAPMAALFPGEYAIWKLLPFVFWLGSIPLAYRLFRSRLEPRYLGALAVLIATNSLLVATSTMLMSEAAYIFFSLLALNLFQYWESQNEGETNWLLLAAIAMTAVFTQLVRTIGLAVVLAVLSALLLSRRFRRLTIVGGLMALAMVPQILLNTGTGGFLFSAHYERLSLGSSSLPRKVSQAWEQILGYASGPIVESVIPLFRPAFIAPFESVGLGVVPGLFNVLILGIVLLGAVRSLPQLNIWDLYVGFYFAAILAFRDPRKGIVQPRYLVPLIPFFYYYLVSGSVWTTSLFSGRDDRWTNLAVGTMATIIVLFSLGSNFQSWREPVRTRTTDLAVGTSWISENSSHDAIVMARNPIGRYLYAQRKTVPYPSPGQDLELGEYIETLGVNYIVVAPRLQTPKTRYLGTYAERHLVPYLEAHSERYCVVFRNPEHNVIVYRVVRDNLHGRNNVSHC